MAAIGMVSRAKMATIGRAGVTLLSSEWIMAVLPFGFCARPGCCRFQKRTTGIMSPLEDWMRTC
jgi:hypothetical protein